jgi:pyruvate,water dikinase
MDTVIGLEAITREDVKIAGGKGANLGELIKVGFPVPPGFVVTA